MQSGEFQTFRLGIDCTLCGKGISSNERNSQLPVNAWEEFQVSRSSVIFSLLRDWLFLCHGKYGSDSGTKLCFFLWFSLLFCFYVWTRANILDMLWIYGLIAFFGPAFRVQEFFSGSRFGDKMSLPLTLAPFSRCVSFSDSEPIVWLFQGWLGLWTQWICGGLSLSEIHCLCWEEWKVSNCFMLFWAWIGKSSQSILLPVLLSSAHPKDDSPTTRCWNLPTRMIKEARR